MPPARDVAIDTLPDHPQIIVAQGAGHAFKFASLIGRILCDLVAGGETGYPIGAFGRDRTTLTAPTYPVDVHIERSAVPPVSEQAVQSCHGAPRSLD